MRQLRIDKARGCSPAMRLTSEGYVLRTASTQSSATHVCCDQWLSLRATERWVCTAARSGTPKRNQDRTLGCFLASRILGRQRVCRDADERQRQSDSAECCPQVQQWRAAGKEPYAYSFQRTHMAAQLQAEYADLPNGEVRLSRPSAFAWGVYVLQGFWQMRLKMRRLSGAACRLL